MPHSLVLVGDSHGLIDDMLHTYDCCGFETATCVFQVGDFGFGFNGIDSKLELPSNFTFIRGNHDNPSECRKHVAYAGDYGIRVVDNLVVGFISGAMSSDYLVLTKGGERRLSYRRQDKNWWSDEQLPHFELQKAVKLLGDADPDIIITHECPSLLWPYLRHPFEYPKVNRTASALDRLVEGLKVSSPGRDRHWYFGHHHQSVFIELAGIKFRCLRELEVYVHGLY